MDQSPSAPPIPYQLFGDDQQPPDRRRTRSTPAPATQQPSSTSRQGASSSASASSSSSYLPQWTAAGTAGGILLGATVAGPVGALIGAAGGLAAGIFRDATGQTLMQGWLQLPEEEKARVLRSAGFAVSGAAGQQQSSGGASADASSEGPSSSSSSRGGLTPEQLDSLPHHPAEDGEVVCILCCNNRVDVVFQPCGHAQVCSQCAAQVLRMSFTGACPVCREGISSVSQVFIGRAS